LLPRAVKSPRARRRLRQSEIIAADIRVGGDEATAAKIDVTSEAEWVELIANTGLINC